MGFNFFLTWDLHLAGCSVHIPHIGREQILSSLEGLWDNPTKLSLHRAYCF